MADVPPHVEEEELDEPTSPTPSISVLSRSAQILFLNKGFTVVKPPPTRELTFEEFLYEFGLNIETAIVDANTTTVTNVSLPFGSQFRRRGKRTYCLFFITFCNLTTFLLH